VEIVGLLIALIFLTTKIAHKPIVLKGLEKSLARVEITLPKYNLIVMPSKPPMLP
jgi:hypothetical protein